MPEYIQTDYNISVDISDLALGQPPVHPPVIQSQRNTYGTSKQQERCVGPVASREAFLGLIGLVDPDTYDLTRRSEGNIHRNGQTNSSR